MAFLLPSRGNIISPLKTESRLGHIAPQARNRVTDYPGPNGGRIHTGNGRRRERIEALRTAGIALLATATNLEEGKVIAAAGIDVVAAQGYEAGGHRGVFDEGGADERLGTVALTRLQVRKLDIPVIAAGGIMDGAGIAAALTLGAAAAQLGTAAELAACLRSEMERHSLTV